MKTQEEGQFFIILYRAYLLDFLLDFLKLNMKIIQLSKPNPMVQSACLCSKPFRNESLQMMAIIHHETQENSQIKIILYWAYLLDFLLDF